jgi:hypothetical protein
MTYLDKLLALRSKAADSRAVATISSSADTAVGRLRKDQGEDRREPAGDLLKSEPAIPVKNSPKFPEGHCSKCGEIGDSGADLIKSDGYLWHRACLQERDRGAQSTICWHCNKPVYRPRYLAWGKDLIPLHERCVGAWIDAWDALLAERIGGDRQ